MVIGSELAVNAESALAAADRVIADLENKVLHLAEELGSVAMMVDAAGWIPLYEYGPDGGLTLSQLHVTSKMLRELQIANPMFKRAGQLRMTYVWGGGVEFSARSAAGKPIAMPAALTTMMQKPQNDRYLFSNSAHEEFERAAFSDGNVFLLVDERTNTVQRIPMNQITADVRNPENHEEIWAFRRQWSPGMPTNGGQPGTRKIVWYYTDFYEGARRPKIKTPGETEDADTGKTMLHLAFNQQVGWAYGTPDSLAAIAWARLYREFMVNGYVMSKALAQLAFKLTAPTRDTATKASAEVALPGQAGGTAALVQGTDLSSMASAGKGYDFASGDSLAQQVAAALEVSVDALLGKTTSGGKVLDAPAKATAIMRRRIWDDHYARIFYALGAAKRIKPVWTDLPEDEVFRVMQAWTLAATSGNFGRDVIQKGMANALAIDNPGPVPTDPASVTPPGGTSGSQTSGNPGGTSPDDSTGATGQGSNSDAGNAPNDHSQDSQN